ncbi:uncharacterized protein IUM83_12869 [Phytophthora cinnamomi]|uniref:uncharacterized protein n=1 Tax=Phytophthora cinnamomi TaxID=4785 RepID=UPI00355A299D|nr:hypothetical protein IUM83_12869 [Phytophthora cinnamomi]
MAFQARWRELKKAGWTSKRPSGLSVDFTYLKPGKTIKGVRGEDFFEGEEMLMKYLDKIDLESCISPRNLDPEFKDADENSSESGDSDEDYQSESVAEQPGVDEESKQDSRTNRESTEAATDDPNKFAGFESDAENDDGDDEDQPDDSVEAGTVQLPVPPQMKFDNGLLSSLGGMENIASGAVPDTFLKEMAVNGWSELATHTPYDYLQEPYEPRSPEAMREDYPNLYSGDSGPTPRALAAASSPSGAFFLLHTALTVGGYCC